MVVRSLVRREFGQASQVLAQAFAEETLFGYLLGGEPAQRARWLLPFLRGMLEGQAPSSDIDGAFIHERLAGVAITVRADRFPLKTRDVLLIAARSLPAGLRIGLWRPRFFQLFRAASMMERNHPRREPSQYMAYLGVDPRARRGGAAYELARTVLKRADTQGIGTYLDTSGEKTVLMCRRLGFQVRHEVRPFPDGPPCYGLWRGPGGRRSPLPAPLVG